MKNNNDFKEINDYSVYEARTKMYLQSFRLLHVLQLNHVLDCDKKNVPCSYGIQISKEEAMQIFIKFNHQNAGQS